MSGKILTESTRTDARCPGCNTTLSYRQLQSSDAGDPVCNKTDTMWWTTIIDDDQVKIVLFCSDACVKKVLSEE